MHLQLAGERPGGRFPLFIEPPVVDQRDQQLAAQGRQKIALEEIAPQELVRLQQLAQARHRAADALIGNRKIVDDYRPFRIGGGEHRVIDALALVKHPELGAQPVRERRRSEHGRFGQRESELELRGLVGQLRRIVGGGDSGKGHDDHKDQNRRAAGKRDTVANRKLVRRYKRTN